MQLRETAGRVLELPDSASTQTRSNTEGVTATARLSIGLTSTTAPTVSECLGSDSTLTSGAN